MKRLIAVFLAINIYGNAFAQTGFSNTPKFIFDVGINNTSINNPAFTGWAAGNYNRNANAGISGLFDITIAGKWDAGFHLSTANPFLVADIEFGKRLTSRHSPIASYINIDYGEFNAMFNDLAPLNYTLTPDQQGKQMQLKSRNSYLGITSRNYVNRLNFFVGRGHNAVFVSGFYAKAGWMPFRKQWEYGYYEDTGSDADGTPTYDFNSVKIDNIPNINNFFFDAGVFIGIGF